MFENKVHRKILSSKRDEVNEGFRILHNMEIHFYIGLLVLLR
jgi:hypothetical protein